MFFLGEDSLRFLPLFLVFWNPISSFLICTWFLGLEALISLELGCYWDQGMPLEGKRDYFGAFEHFLLMCLYV